MKIKILLALLFSIQLAAAQDPKLTQDQYKQDFDYFWARIDEEYSYFNVKQTDWQEVKSRYSRQIDSAQTRDQFIGLLENALGEIYDHHAGLNTNTNHSRRLVPSGTDVWAEYINGKPVITEVRKGFGSEAVGVLAGMEVVAVNDIPVQAALEPFLPKSLKTADKEAESYALRLLLAGNHIQARKFTLKYKGALKDYFPDQQGFQLENIQHPSRLNSNTKDGIGYIRINDCLYDNALVAEFDSVMQTMKNTKALILDLRETPGGGNTTVARAILGWFVNKDHFYQKHEYYAEQKATGIKRSWVEIVSPREGKYFSKPLVVLANHWTGSVGEGIVIAFDGLKRPNTKTIGTQLARLRGAGYSFEMPNTRIRFTFPAERMYHINGSPRENYIPQVYIDSQKEINSTSDVFMKKALQYLKDK